MSILQVLPVLAYAAILCLIFWVATTRGDGQPDWRWPAVAGLLFLLFSLLTVTREGVLQFWINHTTNLTGNQVWFDLVTAVAIAFWLIAPRAKAVGMPLLPWGVAVAATACIALLPMVAQLLYLERRATMKPH